MTYQTNFEQNMAHIGRYMGRYMDLVAIQLVWAVEAGKILLFKILCYTAMGMLMLLAFFYTLMMAASFVTWSWSFIFSFLHIDQMAHLYVYLLLVICTWGRALHTIYRVLKIEWLDFHIW